MKTERVIWICIIVLILIVGGYFIFFNQKTNSIQQNIEKEVNLIQDNIEKKSIENPYDLALSLSDFPSDWEIKRRGEMTLVDMPNQNYEKELGWKRGYQIVFRKVESSDITFTQIISEYPEGNALVSLDGWKEFVKEYDFVYPNEVRKYYKGSVYGKKEYISNLDNSFIGEPSIAYKLTAEDNSYTTYYIGYVRDNFYIELLGSDYELLKELAKKIKEL